MSPEALWLLLEAVDASPVKVGVGPGGVPDRAFAAAADLADRNGLFHPFMAAWLARGGTVPASLGARWQRELRDREALRRTLEALNRVAKRTALEYAVIKNSAVLDPVPRDVDILVPDKTRDGFLAGLREEGFVTVSEDEAEYSLAAPGLHRVDVYSRIHYLGRDFLDVDDLWRSRGPRTTHGVEHPGLDAEASFLVNSIHGLLGHAALSLLDFLDLQALRRTVADLTSARARADRFGWAVAFDRWVGHLDGVRARVYEEGRPVRFPLRHGRSFIVGCVASLNGAGLTLRERRVLDLSLLWDDLMFYSEDSGLSGALRRSRFASLVANLAGHRLRILRGDSKSARPVTGRDAVGRARTWFR